MRNGATERNACAVPRWAHSRVADRRGTATARSALVVPSAAPGAVQFPGTTPYLRGGLKCGRRGDKGWELARGCA